MIFALTSFSLSIAPPDNRKSHEESESPEMKKCPPVVKTGGHEGKTRVSGFRS